jgi:hypothetical protein
MTFGNRFRFSSVALGMLAVALMPAAGFAQSGPAGKGASPQQKAAADKSQNGQKQIEELAEAAKVLGGTAGKPECVWLGRRVVILMWRDDLDTAFRHLDLYDRFSCPSAHIQAAFRCLIKQGPIDPKAQETLNSRAFACWLHPTDTPHPASAPASSAATSAAPASSAPAPR